LADFSLQATTATATADADTDADATATATACLCVRRGYALFTILSLARNGQRLLMMQLLPMKQLVLHDNAVLLRFPRISSLHI